jgi:hypothetical protein
MTGDKYNANNVLLFVYSKPGRHPSAIHTSKVYSPKVAITRHPQD